MDRVLTFHSSFQTNKDKKSRVKNVNSKILLVFIPFVLCVIFIITQQPSSDENENLKKVDSSEEDHIYSHNNKSPRTMTNYCRFRFIKVETGTASIIQYRIKEICDKEDDKLLSYQDVISNLKSNVEFRNSFLDVLRLGLNKKFDDSKEPQAYFFEVCPVTLKNFASTAFEFVLIPAPSLDGIRADPRYVNG